MTTRESPSTINEVHWFCKAHKTPFMRPSNYDRLLVLVPMLPQKMSIIIPCEPLIAPPKPAGPRFPFAAPSKLILKVPNGGLFQKFELHGGLIILLGRELFTVNAKIPHP